MVLSRTDAHGWSHLCKTLDRRYCVGFFETKSHNGKDVNQMRIENISGCELLKKEESVDDVLVVYCAKHPAHKFTTVVGWYKHATVFRHYQEAVFAPEDYTILQCNCKLI